MISIIIPAFNEEKAVGLVVAEAIQVLSQAEYGKFEVIVVDDGSTDRTPMVAEAAGARIVSHPENAGYGRSIKRGIAAAEHDTIIICDADGTYPLDAIPQLLAKYEKGFDMVVGQRTGYREPLFKTILRCILKWLVEYTAGKGIKDVNSGLRVFSKKTISPFFRTLCGTFSFTTSLTLAYLMSGKFVAYVPIEYMKRKGKTKVKLIGDSMRTLQYIVQAALYYNPLRIFILFSSICCLLAAVGFVGSASFGLLSGFLLGVGGLLVALVVFCFGLLADLLKQIMDQQHNG